MCLKGCLYFYNLLLEPNLVRMFIVYGVFYDRNYKKFVIFGPHISYLFLV